MCLKKIKKIHYVTDGAKQQFKNKYQMANLLKHNSDFGIEAEWHFSATAHGKSCLDDIEAKFKRKAEKRFQKEKVSLQSLIKARGFNNICCKFSKNTFQVHSNILF